MSRLPLSCGLAVAALVTTLAACGQVTNTQPPDPIPADASFPPPPPDAQRYGRVTVRVGGAGVPRPQAPVFYHEADGTYAGTVITDGSGMAVIPQMPVGGWLTSVGSPFTSDLSTVRGTFLLSVAGVQPGDEVYLDALPKFPSTTVGTLEVVMPGAFANATRYEVRAGCNSISSTVAQSTLSVALRQNCLRNGQSVDAIVYAIDALGQPLAFISAPAVPLMPSGGTLAGRLDVANGAWQTNLSRIETTPAAAPVPGRLTVRFYGQRGGVPVETRVREEAIPQGGSLRVAVGMASGFHDEMSTLATLRADPIGGSGVISYLQGNIIPPPGNTSTSVLVDMRTEMMSLIPAVALAGAAPRQIELAPPESLACKDNPAPDVVMYALSGDVPDATGRPALHTWFVIAPADLPAPFRLPTLDPVAAEGVWAEEALMNPFGTVGYYSHSERDYNQLRNSPDLVTDTLLSATAPQLAPGIQCATFSAGVFGRPAPALLPGAAPAELIIPGAAAFIQDATQGATEH